jgi:hypothetical protein
MSSAKLQQIKDRDAAKRKAFASQGMVVQNDPVIPQQDSGRTPFFID